MRHGEDTLQPVFREDAERGRLQPQPFGAQADLPGRFLGRDIQAGDARISQFAERLPMPGSPPISVTEPGT